MNGNPAIVFWSHMTAFFCEGFLKFNGVINESVAPDGSAKIMTVFKQVSQIFPLSEMLLFIYFLVCKIYYYNFFITADGGLFTMVSAC